MRKRGLKIKHPKSWYRQQTNCKGNKNNDVLIDNSQGTAAPMNDHHTPCNKTSQQCDKSESPFEMK